MAKRTYKKSNDFKTNNQTKKKCLQFIYVDIYAVKFLLALSTYSITAMARTLMARLPCLTRTRSWGPMIPYIVLLWSISAFMLSCCYNFPFLF